MRHKKYKILMIKQIEGLINPQEAQLLKKHLAECTRCRAEFDLLKGSKNLRLNRELHAPSLRPEAVQNLLPVKTRNLSRLVFDMRYAYRAALIIVGAVALLIGAVQLYKTISFDIRIEKQIQYDMTVDNYLSYLDEESTNNI